MRNKAQDDGRQPGLMNELYHAAYDWREGNVPLLLAGAYHQATHRSGSGKRQRCPSINACI